MYLNKDIIKPWVICLKGDPIEIKYKKPDGLFIVKCNGEMLTVSIHDITDTKPLVEKKPTPATPPKRRR